MTQPWVMPQALCTTTKSKKNKDDIQVRVERGSLPRHSAPPQSLKRAKTIFRSGQREGHTPGTLHHHKVKTGQKRYLGFFMWHEIWDPLFLGQLIFGLRWRHLQSVQIFENERLIWQMPWAYQYITKVNSEFDFKRSSFYGVQLCVQTNLNLFEFPASHPPF